MATSGFLQAEHFYDGHRSFKCIFLPHLTSSITFRCVLHRLEYASPILRAKSYLFDRDAWFWKRNPKHLKTGCSKVSCRNDYNPRQRYNKFTTHKCFVYSPCGCMIYCIVAEVRWGTGLYSRGLVLVNIENLHHFSTPPPPLCFPGS